MLRFFACRHQNIDTERHSSCSSKCYRTYLERGITSFIKKHYWQPIALSFCCQETTTWMISYRRCETNLWPGWRQNSYYGSLAWRKSRNTTWRDTAWDSRIWQNQSHTRIRCYFTITTTPSSFTWSLTVRFSNSVSSSRVSNASCMLPPHYPPWFAS